MEFGTISPPVSDDAADDEAWIYMVVSPVYSQIETWDVHTRAMFFFFFLFVFLF